MAKERLLNLVRVISILLSLSALALTATHNHQPTKSHHNISNLDRLNLNKNQPAAQKITRKGIDIYSFPIATKTLEECRVRGLKCFPHEICVYKLWGRGQTSFGCQCPKLCRDWLLPVCGTDGITYRNLCELQATACAARNNVTVKYQGYCWDRIDTFPPIEYTVMPKNECSDKGIACLGYEECVIDDSSPSSNPFCVCPNSCSETKLIPVCGTDGVIYESKCALNMFKCRNKLLTVAISPPERCLQVNAVKRVISAPINNDRDKLVWTEADMLYCKGFCNPARLYNQCYVTITPRNVSLSMCECPICDYQLTKEQKKPVCGSDGRTYESLCELQLDACSFFTKTREAEDSTVCLRYSLHYKRRKANQNCTSSSISSPFYPV